MATLIELRIAERAALIKLKAEKDPRRQMVLWQAYQAAVRATKEKE